MSNILRYLEYFPMNDNAGFLFGTQYKEMFRISLFVQANFTCLVLLFNWLKLLSNFWPFCEFGK